MKIKSIEAIRLSIPFDSDRPAATQETAWNAASPALRQMETLLVRVETDSGLVGWGEAFGHLSNPVTVEALRQLVIPCFLHKTAPSNREALAAMMAEAEKALHAFGRGGPVCFALSAIDIALWDLLGQQHGQPLWQLLGARRRQIGLYASLVSYNNQPEEVARQVKRAWQAGFHMLKLHETDYAAIAAARAALPEQATLMVDVNCPWPADEASRRARQLAELKLGWLEEPVWPPDDVAGLAAVRRAGTPIASGENACGVAGFTALFEGNAINVAQPSVAKVGGITALLAVIAQAQAHGVKVVPHCFYYGAGLLATAHIVASLPDDIRLEVPFIRFTPLLYPQLDFAPTLTLPDTPGLGFAPDPAVMQTYTVSHLRVDAEGTYYV
ncbi:mandelate racemase/muconate lactonizing enzyme family protein [Mixta sp. Marseille-Q2659]|uniref:mandelate racemase/muconate lactonizing enzyme family protein n=1 Tax=Mixta sp. Marseille-Q2659 TaxID=2736607 RepID=UPI0023B9D295|nr:mandelate racemase/muconate lactonizing enzyme family protein [Mixta sp. Marseille-Q2659]